MKPECLAKLCSEISELYSKVRRAAQDEFKPALTEVINILRDEVPQVQALMWRQKDISGSVSVRRVRFKLDGSEFNHDIGKLTDTKKISNEQAKILKGISQILLSLNSSAELAFGSDVDVVLHIDSGKLEIRELEG